MNHIPHLVAALALTACSAAVVPANPADASRDAPSADATDASSADVVTALDAPARDVPATTDAPIADAPIADAPARDAARTCRTSADCGAAEECFGGAGCETPWTCVPRLGRACSATLVAWCGCDGQTFTASSTCPTRAYAFQGSCGGPPPACVLPGGGMCPVGLMCPAGDGCNTCTCRASGALACTERACLDAGVDAGRDASLDAAADVAAACALPNGTRCPVGLTCPAGDGCNDCTCTASGALMCTARPCAFDAGPSYPTCFSSRECHADEECAGAEGCGTPWTCRPRTGRLCTDDAVPYCGCDGRVYYGSSTCPPSPYAHRGAC